MRLRQAFPRLMAPRGFPLPWGGPLNAIGFRVELQHCRVLRLTSCASVIDDHRPCGSSGDVLAHVALDKPERQIDASRHPGGGPYRAIGNKDAVHLDPDFWKALLQLLSARPVCRRTTPVEQPRLGQSEGGDADGNDAPGARRCVAQESDCT